MKYTCIVLCTACALYSANQYPTENLVKYTCIVLCTACALYSANQYPKAERLRRNRRRTHLFVCDERTYMYLYVKMVKRYSIMGLSRTRCYTLPTHLIVMLTKAFLYCCEIGSLGHNVPLAQACFVGSLSILQSQFLFAQGLVNALIYTLTVCTRDLDRIELSRPASKIVAGGDENLVLCWHPYSGLHVPYYLKFSTRK